MNHNDDDHWLVRPTTVKKLWWAGSIVLALTVIAQLLIPVKGYFTVDSWPAFGAVFGFFSCLIMVLMSKVLGWILKREESYYADSEAEDDA
jgi:hypothetical protein